LDGPFLGFLVIPVGGSHLEKVVGTRHPGGREVVEWPIWEVGEKVEGQPLHLSEISVVIAVYQTRLEAVEA